ncbi:MAG: NigD-like protein [Dysgonamonadaceae bacterium]|jgi:hypothetical protein|nr:NigD-like protein [Dysgonamonadaceae bacterium]
MRRNLAFVWGVLVLFAISACDKDQVSRIDDYFEEFATVMNDGLTVKFKLDNQRTLIPSVPGAFSDKKDTQRVALNYTPLNGDTVKVNAAPNVFTDSLRTDKFPAEYHTDPVKIQSVWVGGNYLNAIVEVEYHDAAHTAALFLPNPAEPGKLYFSYSRNGDAAGYPRTAYLSFSLDGLRDKVVALPFNFVVYINTHEGMRNVELRLK